MVGGNNTLDREIIISRVLSAPRELVFKAWTDPKHLPQWWGPRGFSITTQSIEVKTGGVWQFIMHGPDGVDYPNRIVYNEIVSPERIVYSHGGGDQADDADFHVTATFVAQGQKTLLTLHSVFPTAAARDHVVKEYRAIEGGNQTMDRLEEKLSQLSGGNDFVITRMLDASRDLVWKVWTEPEHLKKWFGPKGFSMPTCKMDLRQGGIFHYCMKSPDGHEMWGKWVFREIVKPERIMLVNSFSDEKGGATRHPMSATWPLEMISTTTFTEQGGKTILTLKWAPLNANESEVNTFETGRDGMQGGWMGTFDQLDKYLAEAKGGN